MDISIRWICGRTFAEITYTHQGTTVVQSTDSHADRRQMANLFRELADELDPQEDE